MTMWERLRNPCGWRAGAKQISVDAMIPIFAVPTLALIAAQTVLCTVIIFVATPILVYYLHHNFLRFLLRTKFFLMWTITSVVMLMLIFEVNVVPLLEILLEENIVFIMCVVGGIWCGYMTRSNADSVTQEGTLTQGLELGEGSGELCITCRRRAPPKAHHCRMCQTCILNREYHCKCIALCFISALYSLLVGLVIVCYLIYHLWLIYLGTTSNERRLLEAGSPCDHGMLKNVSRLFCCKT
ncbi:palmitoyltransferase ZDHHC23-A isoform X2 [Frieseomelitta varia]|uniref:palmitoyltransferase ZDHHC23-A isoform X2 n=1 Tax=Frieseomelitta varia TaxID=561572 RepID=UPI001CB6907D|nr:palmitoyltransferase ZDHHC23-A isoform X2 [Frieseomelitta varia]